MISRDERIAAAEPNSAMKGGALAVSLSTGWEAPGTSESREVVRIPGHLMPDHRDRSELLGRHPLLDDLAGPLNVHNTRVPAVRVPPPVQHQPLHWRIEPTRHPNPHMPRMPLPRPAAVGLALTHTPSVRRSPNACSNNSVDHDH
jgi:hypothetical protein